MIIALLIITTGIVPIILGFGILVLYGRSNITISLFIYMLLVGIWQLDIAVLFLDPSFVSPNVILILFKIFRLGIIFCVPVILWLSYNIVHQEELKSFNKFFQKIYLLLINKYTILITLLWSTFVFIINLTDYGVSGLTKVTNEGLNTVLYYPTSGELGYIFKSHFTLYFITMFLLLNLSINLKNIILKRFMLIFTIASIVLYIISWGNLNPDRNLLFSNISVTLYSCVIIFSFIKLYSNILNHYQKVMERQTKLNHAGNIASSLIHEINNSLSVIKGSIQVLPIVVPLNETGKEMLTYMEDASMQLENLVTSYKDFLKNNNIVLKLSMENISKIVERSYNLNKDLFISKNVSFHFKFKEIFGYIDKVYFNQVLTNLIINSIDAIPGHNMKKEILVEINSNDDTIIIDFKDSGTGIPKDKWDTLFTPFISSKEKGMGLGLALCQNVVFAHNGNIKVVDSSEQGTHIQIVLPKGKFNQI